jgi:uncharacterized protein (TIGR03790 family)
MKNSLLILFLFSFCALQVVAQTNATVPGPEHVLVVYKLPNPNNPADTISRAVMRYYQQVRGIPNNNIVSLTLPISEYDGAVELVQGGEVIRRMGICSEYGSNGVCDNLAWQYFETYIAEPIRNALNTRIDSLTGNYLYNQIRYIVLCKEIPIKIWSQDPYWYWLGANVSVDALLTVLNTNGNNNPEPLSLYFPNNDDSHRKLNPYSAVDPFFTMEHRFMPNFYSDAALTLSYLVSRLDAETKEEVIAMIDRSKNADTSGTGLWILDGDPAYGGHNSDAMSASDKLETLGFYDTLNITTTPIFNSSRPVMGYTSQGAHAGYEPTYFQTSLQFNYLFGAVANTYESFNCYSIDPSYRHSDGHGLISEFVKRRIPTYQAGTAAVGHSWEPYEYGVIANEYFFPSYAVGYNLVDAAYMGMKKLVWQNIVIGDPLTKIMNYEIKSLASDSTITTIGNFIGRLVVPAGKRLTIQSGVTLNFNRNSSLQVNGILEVQQGAALNFNSYSSLVFNSGSGSQILNGVLNFRKKARLELKNDFTLTNSSSFNFFDNSQLNAINLTIGSGEFLTFNGNSNLVTEELILSPGTILNFNDQCSLKVKHRLIANGTESNKIRLNLNNVAHINSATNVEIQNAILTGGKLEIIASNLVEVVNININGVNFIANPNSNITINGGTSSSLCNAYLSNINMSGGIITGINLVNIYDSEVRDVIISNNSENTPPESSTGISGLNCSRFKVYDCRVNKFEFGISYNYGGRPEEGYTNVYLLLTGNEISNCINGIYANRCTDGFVEISKNNIFSPFREANQITTAIAINNSNEVNIESNTIYDFDYGVSLSLVTYPNILDNKIHILNYSDNVQAGIFSNSGKGMYRLNHITKYKKGIDLGNSFPLIGQNIITDNTETGIYIGPNSFPDLSRGYIQKEESMREFPISGLNHISNNGGLCSYDPYDGAEIYIEDASIELSQGCNTIEDNRLPDEYVCNTQKILIAKAKGENIFAELNYWGNHPEYGHNPAERIFSDVQVFFEPYLVEPCIKYKDDNFIVLMDSRKEHVIDTIYSFGTTNTFDSLTNQYAVANKYFFDGNFPAAKQTYTNIIQLYGLNRRCIEAYNKIYTINKLTNASSTAFNELMNFYDAKLLIIQDTLLFKAVNHLRDLCLVAKQDYAAAISNFSGIITQNPNSEEAFFAAIDILTTSLLDTGNTSLGKVAGIDLSVKNADDFRDKLNALVRARNSKQSLFTSKVIPTEYTLYQNYPNPFNPLTKIQYDITTDTKVQLKIYDILGREVKTLVNEFQNAGRYNVEFNASNLASGVYIYQLSAKGYVKSRKLVIVK